RLQYISAKQPGQSPVSCSDRDPNKSQTVRRKVDKKNLDKTITEFMMWDDITRKFDQNLVEMMETHVLIVVSSCQGVRFSCEATITNVNRSRDTPDVQERSRMIVECETAWIMGPNQNPPTGAVDFTLDHVLDEDADSGGTTEPPKDLVGTPPSLKSTKLEDAFKTMVKGETRTRDCHGGKRPCGVGEGWYNGFLAGCEQWSRRGRQGSVNSGGVCWAGNLVLALLGFHHHDVWKTTNQPFEARLRDYMAANTKRMERFENAILMQCEEINGRMTEMFGLLKELTTNRTPEKKLIDGLVDNHRLNDSLSRARIGKTKKKTYNISPKGLVYEAIPRKRITKKEDIRGNFKIPCNIGGQKGINALVDQGSDVNIMPYTTYMKLTNERPVETDIRLSLASHSYIHPLGIAEDILVDVAEHVYPVDFIILDIKEDENRPFILGTPFLTTAKAIIKFDKGTITLERVIFDEKKLGNSYEISLDDSWRMI
ncbi:zinc finger, CCHC-type containing protein, partial [Tanacetum coccineum]